MIVSENCLNLLKAFEGLGDGDPKTVRIDPYLDAVGNWTVGYGHLLRDHRGVPYRGRSGFASVREMYPKGITKEQAERMLQADAEKVALKLTALQIGGSQAQCDAFISLAFNIGIGDPQAPRAGGFLRSTLLSMHRDGRPAPKGDVGHDALTKLADASKLKIAPQDIIQAFTAYSWAGGRWLLGLFRRRVVEALVYRGDPLDKALETVRDFYA